MKNLEDFVENLKQYPVRHVFEFRHKSWLVKKVLKLLSASNIAICMADWPDFIDELPLTADFVYIRRHGDGGSYATNYTTEQLKKDAKRIKEYLKLGKDVYIYFNNDAFAYAPKNALEIKAILESIIPKSLKVEKREPEAKPKRARAVKKKTRKKKIGKKAIPKKTAAKIAKTTKKKTAKKPDKATKKTAAKKVTRKTKKTAVKKSPKKAASKKTAKTIKKTARKPGEKTVKKSVKKK
jgi:hypothetical protein